MKGKIVQWIDDKAFGFIQPDDGSEKLFFHITSVKTDDRRPQVGDVVLYEAKRDAQHRLKAVRVVLEGLHIDQHSEIRKQSIRTEPRTKDFIDYLLYFVIFGATLSLGFEFYHVKALEGLWPFALVIVVASLILSRQKKPKEKSFQCSRCRVVAQHDPRTIKAWNNGSSKLYCRTCHSQWLKDNPRAELPITKNQKNGCLGVLSILIMLPILGGVGLYQWLT